MVGVSAFSQEEGVLYFSPDPTSAYIYAVNVISQVLEPTVTFGNSAQITK
jgi:hypothetical protein